MMCSWKGAGKWHTGDLLTRIGSDASEVLGMGMGILPNLLVTGLQLTGSFLYLWILDARLAGSYWERPLLSYYRKSISGRSGN